MCVPPHHKLLQAEALCLSFVQQVEGYETYGDLRLSHCEYCARPQRGEYPTPWWFAMCVVVDMESNTGPFSV